MLHHPLVSQFFKLNKIAVDVPPKKWSFAAVTVSSRPRYHVRTGNGVQMRDIKAAALGRG